MIDEFPVGGSPYGIALAPDGTVWAAPETGSIARLRSEYRGRE
ncbi:hypothetical protein [Catenuloplanes indicus]|uniref:Streptogramin lyase n=1 Tax=Catenuloplanes indicus TaxID=137267 RepID=A0AAE3VYI8_9ACTN|nr:hypothetical protein [Catenuloplanes indicus]MDQ0366065.1 streptogramin lyase [Catenuloplanes indicus]